MTTEDVTRLLHQPSKHYVGARLQMARPTLDSDFNEDAVVDAEELREATLDIVGAKGRLDSGFGPDLKVGDVLLPKLVRFGSFFQAFVLDYNLKPGTMYLGGRRFEQPRLESAVFQREYLQIGPATAPRAAVGTYRHMSYLRTWEQPVSTVEDSELVEYALGGADAALRVRPMRRVEVRSVQSVDCADAFDEVVTQLTQGIGATFDPKTCELRSDAKLQMTFYEPPIDGDCPACVPSLHGQYLGSENHAIRIMLATSNSYVWAFDDAAPLYRVRIVVDGSGGASVHMLTPPKDDYHHPRTDTVVEFLPWSALLENGDPWAGKFKILGERVHNEKVATAIGFFAQTDAPYDPGTRDFHVQLAPDAATQLSILTNKDPSKAKDKALKNLKTNTTPTAEVIALRWDEQHPHAHELNPADENPDGFEAFVYMRVWQRRADADPLAIPISSQSPLGDTGLVPVFSGPGKPGDYWLFAVRPAAPEQIVPLEIMRAGGISPHGPRERIAPISLTTWESALGIAHEVVAIEDCRPRIVPLTERGCDTLIVGPDGDGDYPSIGAAVQALPSSGGQIRLLPGTYREEFAIEGRRDVTIIGCGAATVIESPVGASAEALISVQLGEGLGNIRLRDFSVVATGQIGIAVGGERIACERLHVLARGDAEAVARPCVQILDGRDVRLRGCTLEMDGSLSDHAAVYMESPGLGVLIEDCDIRVLSGDLGVLAWGGVHIGGGSRDVEIRASRITGGRGHGVTLGSVLFRATDGRELAHQGAGRGQSDSASPFHHHGRLSAISVVDENDPTTAPTLFYPEPQDPIEGVIVADNRIHDMGGSGISSLAVSIVHPPEAKAAPLCIREESFPAHALSILDNEIVDNGLMPPPRVVAPHAIGGIVISHSNGLRVTGNRVLANAAAPGLPGCGLFVAAGEFLEIASNRFEANGGTGVSGSATGIGPGAEIRGGVVLMPARLAARGQVDVRQTVVRRVLLRGNTVDQLEGAALLVVAVGECTIVGNHLTTQAHASARLGDLGATVVVVNAGRPWEAVDLPTNQPSAERWIQPQWSQSYLQGAAQKLDPNGGGAVLFASNQTTSQWSADSAPPESAGIAAAITLVSSDAVTMTNNQLNARVPEAGLTTHALVVGPTVTASNNRLAENLEATRVSLATASILLNVTGANTATHCHAVYGGPNHLDPDYYLDEDNLVWFDPKEGCDAELKAIGKSLQAVIELLNSTSSALTSAVFEA